MKPAGVLEGEVVQSRIQGLHHAVQTQMFQMMVNKQTRQLRMAPHVLLVPPPIHCLGHPAVRPAVPPEGSRFHHCEAAQVWMWKSDQNSTGCPGC